jgi:hypothetical protein
VRNCADKAVIDNFAPHDLRRSNCVVKFIEDSQVM